MSVNGEGMGEIPYMVHLIYTYLTLFSVRVSYLYKLDNI